MVRHVFRIPYSDAKHHGRIHRNRLILISMFQRHNISVKSNMNMFIYQEIVYQESYNNPWGSVSKMHHTDQSEVGVQCHNRPESLRRRQVSVASSNSNFIKIPGIASERLSITERTATIYGKKCLPPHTNFDRKVSPRTSTAWVNKNGKPAVNFVCFRQVVVAFVFNQNIISVIPGISRANTNKKNGRLRFAEVFFRSRRIGTCPRWPRTGFLAMSYD